MQNRVVKEIRGGKFVITIDAWEYGLDGTGTMDCTAGLQSAIDDCQAAGGGTVYLPEGRYALHGILRIRTSVMLHGAGEDRTVLDCYYGRGEEQDMQICMEACTGLMGVALYYPAQDMRNPVPYPPTVRQQGSDSITVEKVTFVNPWTGIQCGPDGNELHFIKEVRMSPLFQGIFMDMTTDIGRLQNVSVSPSWYGAFIRKEKVDGDCAESLALAAAEYMYAHATGIYMARSDWEYGYDIAIEGMHTGILITSGQDIGPNTQLSGVTITDCATGIRLHRGNPYGIAVTDSRIVSRNGKGRTAIQCDATFDAVLQCYGVDIEGSFVHLVCQEGCGQLSFAECHFTGKGSKEDVLQKAGGLSLLNVVFAPRGIHVHVCEGAGGTQIVGCRAGSETGGEVTVVAEKEAAQRLYHATKKLPFAVKRSKGHVPYPYATEPEGEGLFSVVQYGAAGDGVSDDTEAFVQALGEAGRTGGYVYVPGGKYRITKPLRIPAGVELRGTAEVPCHTMGGGSVIMVCCGQGEEDGTPFLSMEGRCGIRGIVLYHPDQDPVVPHAYPWTVQSVGDRCYVVDTVFVNAWQGIDFGSAGGKEHYISYVSGAPIRCGILAGRNEGAIWIENVQYNPHYWYRCDLPGRPGGDTWKAFWHNQIKYLDAFVYGANHSLHVLNTFVFAARNGVRFIVQEGKGTSGTIIGHGTDGGECGIRIDSLEDVEFVNTELVTIESPNRRIYLRNGGSGAMFYNTLMWGAPDVAVLMETGRLGMLLTNIVDSGERAFLVEAGEAVIAATYFYTRKKQLLAKGGRVHYLANMAGKDGGETGTHLEEVESAGGQILEAHNWYK